MRRTKQLEAIAEDVERVLAQQFPDVELVDLALRGGSDAALALFIDRPEGVDLDLCAEVSRALDGLRERYALEVSSPGLDRPLTKAAHFQAALGSLVSVRTEEAIGDRSNFRGQLTSASDTHAHLALEETGEDIRLAYEEIARARVIHRFDNGGRHE